MMSGSERSLIWILEDELALQDLYRDLLSDFYRIRCFCAYSEFAEAIETERPDLALVDLNLSDGLILDRLRAHGHHIFDDVPYVVISGMGDMDALRSCLEAGALDYLIKPVHPNGLMAKIEHILKRASAPNLEGQFEDLTRNEWRLLKLLMDAKGRPVSRKTIFDAIWKNTSVQANTLDVHIYHLRRKLSPKGYSVKSLPGGVGWSLCEISRQDSMTA